MNNRLGALPEFQTEDSVDSTIPFKSSFSQEELASVNSRVFGDTGASNIASTSDTSNDFRSTFSEQELADVSSRVFGEVEPEGTSLLEDIGSGIADIGSDALGVSANAVLQAKEGVVGLASLATSGIARGVEAATGLEVLDLGQSIDALENVFVGATGIKTMTPAQADLLYSKATSDQKEKFTNSEGFINTLKTAASNPRGSIAVAVESLGSIALTGGLSGTIQKLGVKNKAVSLAIAEGLVGAGHQAQAIRKTNEQGKLGLSGSVSALLTGAGTSIVARLGGKLSDKVGAFNPDSLFSGNITRATSSRLSSGIKSALIEGTEELGQSGLETVLFNAATGKPLTEGLSTSLAQGLVAGGTLGGISGTVFSGAGTTRNEEGDLLDIETNAPYQNKKVVSLLEKKDSIEKLKKTQKARNISTEQAGANLDKIKEELSSLKKEGSPSLNSEIDSAISTFQEDSSQEEALAPIVEQVNRERELSTLFEQEGFSEEEALILANNVRLSFEQDTSKQDFADSLPSKILEESIIARKEPGYFQRETNPTTEEGASFNQEESTLNPEQEISSEQELSQKLTELEEFEPNISNQDSTDLSGVSNDPNSFNFSDKESIDRRDPSRKKTFFEQPEDVQRRRFSDRLQELDLGITDQSVLDKIDTLLPEAVPDDVTGFHLASEKEPSVNRAIRFIKDNPDQTAHFVEADISNLGGLNAYFKNNPVPANRIYRKITDIYKSEIEKVSKASTFIRHGGDEFSTVIVGASQGQIDSVSKAIKEKVDAMIAEEGLSDIPHPKSTPESPKANGVSVYFGSSPIFGDSNSDSIFEASSKGVDAGKTGKPSSSGISLKSVVEDVSSINSKELASNSTELTELPEVVETFTEVLADEITRLEQELNSLDTDPANDAQASRLAAKIRKLVKEFDKDFSEVILDSLDIESDIAFNPTETLDNNNSYFNEDELFLSVKSRDTVPEEAVSNKEAKEVLGHISSRISKKNSSITKDDIDIPLTFELVESTGSLPKKILNVKKEGVKGVYDHLDNKIWLVSSNHSTKEDLVKTIAHELIGHMGTRKLLGDKVDSLYKGILSGPLLKDVLLKVKKWDVYLESWNSKNDINLEDKKTVIKTKVNGETVLIPQKVAMRLADEYVAEIAASEVFFTRFIKEQVGFSKKVRSKKSNQRKVLLNRVLTKLSHMLRSVFGKFSDSISKDEIRVILAESTNTLFKRTNFDYTVLSSKGELDVAKQNGDSEILGRAVEASFLAKEAAIKMGADVQSVVNMSKVLLQDNFGSINQTSYNKQVDRVSDRIRNHGFFSKFFALGSLNNPELLGVIQSKQAGSIKSIQNFSREYYKLSRSLTDSGSQDVLLYFSTKDAEVPAGILLNNTKKDLAFKELLPRAKQEISNLGEQLVGLGMLDAETYLENDGSYVRTRYVKYLTTFQGSSNRPSFMDYLKRKDPNLSQEDVDRLGKITDPGFLIAESLSQMSRDIALHQMYSSIFDVSDHNGLRWVLGDAGNLTDTNGNKIHVVKLEERISHLKDLVSIHEKAESKRALNFSKERFDIIREELRESEAIKESYDKSVQEDAVRILTDRNGKEPTKEDIAFFLEKDFKRLPDSKRFGKLSGQYVRREIYSSFLEIDDAFSEMRKELFGAGSLSQAAIKGHAIWKWSKVAANAPSYFRNAMSNMVNLDTGSNTSLPVLTGWVMDTASSLFSGKPNKYLDLAKSHGLFDTTLSAHELQSMQTRFSDSIKRAEASSKAQEVYFFLNEQFHSLVDITSQAFGLMEGLFKTVALRDHITRWEKENSKTIESISIDERAAVIAQGAIHANNTLYDYSKVNETVGQFRRAPLGTPFLTYMYKTFPVMIENTVKRPHKMAKYMAIPSLMAYLVMSGEDWTEDDFEEFENKLPSYTRESSTTMVVPFKIDGKLQLTNFDYIFPPAQYMNAGLKARKNFRGDTPADLATSIVGTSWSLASETFGMLGGPLPKAIVSLKTNEDDFTHKSIWTEGAPASQKVQEYLLYMYNQSFPSFITEPGVLNKMRKSVLGHKKYSLDSPKETLAQAATGLVGLSLKDADPIQGQRFNNFQFEKQRRAIDTAKRKAIRSLQQKNGSSEDMASLVKSFTFELKRLENTKRAYLKSIGS